MPGENQKYIKLTFFVRKKEGISDEQFYKHWAEVHGDVCKQVLEFTKYIKRYVQYHTTSEARALAQSVLGADTLSYDGCAEFWMESLEDFIKFRDCPDYKKIVEPDADLFVGAVPYVMVGYEYLQHGPSAF